MLLRRTRLDLLLWLLLLTGVSQACIKTSTYYRSQFRSQTHVFVPEEYRPMRPERSLEASGPLEAQDFQTAIPTTRLVRVDVPNLQFASEEARWMTKVSSPLSIYCAPLRFPGVRTVGRA
uniref:Transmembrane protein n=1 Tax=Mesocestoides corti TaxID=53468 RepID=A0A5K3FXU6_MESCO